MNLRQRMLVLALLMIVAVMLYGIARYYSPALVALVVEETLIQKAPPEADATDIRQRFRARLKADISRGARLELLLEMSQFLEKVQKLTPAQVNDLLAPGVSNYWNSFPGNFSGRIVSKFSLASPARTA